MPDFKYIVFPILDQAQITLEKIFCTVEYSNRTVSLNGIEYHYVEKKEYEDESFESQLLGVFTPEYAEEYTEMMYSGDEPLYIDSDGDLYVNPLLLNEYTKSEYDRDAVYLTSYNEEESAAVRVTDEGGNVHNYELKMIDGIWYLNCKFDFLNF